MPTDGSITVRILPKQVPQLWDAIKYACTQVNEIDKEDAPYYFNELLQALLSEKAQCFVRLDKDRVLLSILITRILVDTVTGEKYIYAQCLYSMRAAEDESWMDHFRIVVKFAKTQGCTYASFTSANPRMWHLGEKFGFREKHREFTMKLGGS